MKVDNVVWLAGSGARFQTPTGWLCSYLHERLQLFSPPLYFILNKSRQSRRELKVFSAQERPLMHIEREVVRPPEQEDGEYSSAPPWRSQRITSSYLPGKVCPEEWSCLWQVISLRPPAPLGTVPGGYWRRVQCVHHQTKGVSLLWNSIATHSSSCQVKRTGFRLQGIYYHNWGQHFPHTYTHDGKREYRCVCPLWAKLLEYPAAHIHKLSNFNQNPGSFNSL